jgi:hypothetical protein
VENEPVHNARNNGEFFSTDMRIYYMPQTYRLKFILPSFKKTNYFGHGFFFFI